VLMLRLTGGRPGTASSSLQATEARPTWANRPTAR
jgi:hypothetical protein